MPVSQESPLEVASPFSATAERAGSESGTPPHVSKSFAYTHCSLGELVVASGCPRVETLTLIASIVKNSSNFVANFERQTPRGPNIAQSLNRAAEVGVQRLIAYTTDGNDALIAAHGCIAFVCGHS